MSDYILRRIFSIMRDLDTPGVCPYRAVYGKNMRIYVNRRQ